MLGIVDNLPFAFNEELLARPTPPMTLIGIIEEAKRQFVTEVYICMEHTCAVAVIELNSILAVKTSTSGATGHLTSETFAIFLETCTFAAMTT